MKVIGREAEWERLQELAGSHARIALVGLPGMGKAALATRFVRENAAWSLDGEENVIRTLSRPPAEPGEAVVRVGPLAPGAALELLASEVERRGGTLQQDEGLDVVMAKTGMVPAALAIAARLVAAEGVTRVSERLVEHSLWSLAGNFEETQAWKSRLEELLTTLDAASARSLAQLSFFSRAFSAHAVEELCDEPASLTRLAELGLLVHEGPRSRLVSCVGTLARDGVSARDDADALRERFVRYVLVRAEGPKEREALRPELEALFRAAAPIDARRAGALLAPIVADAGPLRPHLRRLIEIDEGIEGVDATTECAIAQLRLVIGEPEAAWRRLEAAVPIAGDLSGRAHHLAGSCLRRLGRGDEAETHYAKAIAAFEVADPHGELGMVLSNLGGLLVEGGDADAARRTWSRALRHFVAEEDPRAEAIVLGDLGLLDHESGDYDGARRRYERALLLHGETGNTRFCGIVSGDLGELALLCGSPKEATVHLQQALAFLEKAGDARQATLIHGALALAEAGTGDVAGGRRHLDDIRDRAPEDLWPVMDLYDAAMAVHEARAARGEGELKRESARLTRVHTALAKNVTSPDEARRAAQIVRAELRRYEEHGGWAIAHDAAYFVTPGDARVDLSRRRVSQRLVRALLDARLAKPGQPLSLEELLRAGWPGQRVLQAAARNRLHVALSGIRKLGLDAILLREADGYLLDPATELSVTR